MCLPAWPAHPKSLQHALIDQLAANGVRNAASRLARTGLLCNPPTLIITVYVVSIICVTLVCG